MFVRLDSPKFMGFAFDELARNIKDYLGLHA